MPPTADFFDQRREWSRWKHEVLRRYLPKFAGILGSRHPRIYYVDAFAGAGVYREEPPVPGSPLIAAGLSATLAESQKWSYELHCINVEPDKQSFLKLRDATTAYRPPTVRNMHGSFDEKLPEILQLIELHPSLFFLDPFGY